MLRRLLAAAAAVLLFAGVLAVSGPEPVQATNWSLGLHWPRWYGLGSTATETRIYFVADAKRTTSWTRDYVTWAAHRWSASPAVVAIPITAHRCPSISTGQFYPCVVWRTGDLNGGLTWISVGGNKHILSAVVTLDRNVGLGSDVAQDRNIACHEGGHALGGGFENGAIPGSEHYVCNGSGYPTSHDFADLARVYNHHG